MYPGLGSGEYLQPRSTNEHRHPPKKKKERKKEKRRKNERTKSLLSLAKRPGKGKPCFPAHIQQQQWAQSCSAVLMRAYLLPMPHLTALQYNLSLVSHQVTVPVTPTGLVSSSLLSRSRRGPWEVSSYSLTSSRKRPSKCFLLPAVPAEIEQKVCQHRAARELVKRICILWVQHHSAPT